MPWYETFANWILQEVAAAIVLALVGIAVGGLLSKWYFGKKNDKILRKLSKKVKELERSNRTKQAAPAATAATEPSSSTQSVAQDKSISNDVGNILEPKMLVNLVKEARTELAAKQIISPYKGKKMTVSGTVRDVSSRADHIAVSLNLSAGITALLFFDNIDNGEYFVALEPGMSFTASGKLYSAHDSGISLDQCELV